MVRIGPEPTPGSTIGRPNTVAAKSAARPAGIVRHMAPTGDRHFMPWSSSSHDADQEAMVYNAVSITPRVMQYFSEEPEAGLGQGNASSGELISKQRLQALRHGHAKLQWRLCNPLRDSRLARSLCGLSVYASVAVLALSCLTVAACFWTSHAATPKRPLQVGSDIPLVACEGGRRGSRELRSLLLSIDTPMFIFVAIWHILAMKNLTNWVSSPSGTSATWAIGMLGTALTIAGCIVVGIRDPAEVWGTKGSVGFAGIWVGVQNATGICSLAWRLTRGDRECRIVQSRTSAAHFAFILFSSATAIQGCYYIVGFFEFSGLPPAIGLSCLFAATFAVLSSIKAVLRQWSRVPPLACTFMLYCFQAGAYTSFRLVLQTEESIDMLVGLTITAAVSEIVLRASVVCTGKLMYNYYVEKGQAAMALRVLDVHVATVLVDILAEWAAIAIAGVLGVAVDETIFDGLRSVYSADGFIGMMALQIGVEVLADVTSVAIAFAILPVSLEGVFASRGHLLLQISCVLVAPIFLFAMLNMRVRIECFT
ncbi:unnamed protein product [Prorocentrum cordatum]|uniref:H(+)-exporting diphosphatase n=1 Tax=Prorocentrum cordatum TaxID=2364126 RepID=A0ABN9TEZ8_9DINO|nr:unnamed protein product [Polarella glacialis]